MRGRRFLFLSVMVALAALAAHPGKARAEDAGKPAAVPSVRDLPAAEVYRYEICDGKSRRIAGGDTPPVRDMSKLAASPCSLGTDTIIPAKGNLRQQIDSIIRKHTGTPAPR